MSVSAEGGRWGWGGWPQPLPLCGCGFRASWLQWHNSISCMIQMRKEELMRKTNPRLPGWEWSLWGLWHLLKGVPSCWSPLRHQAVRMLGCGWCPWPAHSSSEVPVGGRWTFLSSARCWRSGFWKNSSSARSVSQHSRNWINLSDVTDQVKDGGGKSAGGHTGKAGVFWVCGGQGLFVGDSQS